MKLIAKRPLLLSLVTAVALLVAQVGPAGFHEW
jgi:hypothetical protein